MFSLYMYSKIMFESIKLPQKMNISKILRVTRKFSHFKIVCVIIGDYYFVIGFTVCIQQLIVMGYLDQVGMETTVREALLAIQQGDCIKSVVSFLKVQSILMVSYVQAFGLSSCGLHLLLM